MPKMKSHSGTAKRVKRTGSGKLRASSAMSNHLLSNKSKASKRRHKSANFVSASDYKRIKQQVANIK